MLWRAGLVLLLCWGSTGELRHQPRDSPEREDPTSKLQADSASVSTRQQRSPPPVEPLDFGFVPSGVYDTHAYYEPGAIGVLFHMVHAFLYVVQPNPFPKGEEHGSVCVCVCARLGHGCSYKALQVE